MEAGRGAATQIELDEINIEVNLETGSLTLVSGAYIQKKDWTFRRI